MLLLIAFTLSCPAQSANPKPKHNTKQSASVTEELIQCRSFLKNWAGLDFDVHGMNTEGLITTSAKLDSCIHEQGTALSNTDLLTAYKLLGDISAAEMELLARNITTVTESGTAAKDAALKTAGEVIGKQSSDYNALATRYNLLVDEYNRLLTDYRSYVTDEGRFLTSLQSYLNSISASYRWTPPSPPQVTYTAPIRSQIDCTTQTLPPPAPGLSSWSYTNCH